MYRVGQSGAPKSGAPERRSEDSERERERRCFFKYGARAGAPLHFEWSGDTNSPLPLPLRP